MVTVCTFNINNLFLRYKFGSRPGDDSKNAVPALWGYLPLQEPGKYSLHNTHQRQFCSLALRLPDGSLPDILCMQEVESLAALRLFNTKHLDSHYNFAALLDSHDLRQIDVGILSTLPIVSLRSNVDTKDTLIVETPEDRKESEAFPWLFSRDCLEVELDIGPKYPGTLTLFINHFKSKMAKGETSQERRAVAERSARKRLRQAKGVLARLRERFPGNDYTTKLFAVVGDLNDEPGTPPLEVLTQDGKLTNVLDKLPEQERWTHYYQGGEDDPEQVAQFDYLLLSPALASLCTSDPVVNRAGIGGRALSCPKGELLPKELLLSGLGGVSKGMIPFTFWRYPGVGAFEAASDHCPVCIAF